MVAVTADIEKAFLMVQIKPSDRDMLRFLWLKSPHDVESEVLELRIAHLVFGLQPSPAIQGYVISHHLDKYQSRHPKIIQSIKTHFTLVTLYQGEIQLKKHLTLIWLPTKPCQEEVLI